MTRMQPTNSHEFFCMQCSGLNTFTFDNGKPRQYTTDEDKCQYCGGKQFRRGNEPTVAWHLTENDKRMLRGIRIAAE
jgi:DNA-directed RNA polymerase subunit RPC12/RpoP